MATKTFTQFRVDNVVTTLPTTLAYGQEVYYKDANGNLTLWVGHEDGSAWPSVGYKEYVALLTQEGTSAPVATVLSNTIGNIGFTRSEAGVYLINSSGLFLVNKTTYSFLYPSTAYGLNILDDGGVIIYDIGNNASLLSFNTLNTSGEQADGLLNNTVNIRIYP